MIGHDSIVCGDDARCQCGHQLLRAEDMPSEITWSSVEPSPTAVIIQARWDQHIAELADRKLYGFDGDEYLQTDPVVVYERWNDDQDFDPNAIGPLPPLEIIEWSVVDLNTQIPAADSILEWIAEITTDDMGYGEAGEAAINAAGHPDVVQACEALRSAFAAHFTGWSMADQKLRTLIVTWDENGEPLLDGEPMYRKVES